jgi:hypothetical protein
MTKYDNDVLVWSQEQARLLREGRFAELDIEHLADEIEDVGRSEKRELSSRMAVLMARLLKWAAQPERRGRSWEITIREQRKRIAGHIKETPSLAPLLDDAAWIEAAWGDAIVQFARETGLDDFPDSCPWPVSDIISENWLPPALV